MQISGRHIHDGIISYINQIRSKFNNDKSNKIDSLYLAYAFVFRIEKVCVFVYYLFGCLILPIKYLIMNDYYLYLPDDYLKL